MTGICGSAALWSFRLRLHSGPSAERLRLRRGDRRGAEAPLYLEAKERAKSGCFSVALLLDDKVGFALSHPILWLLGQMWATRPVELRSNGPLVSR